MELTRSPEIVVPSTLTGASVERLLADVTEHARACPDVLVIRGSVERFCSGLDLEEAIAGSPVTATRVAMFAACLEALRRFPAPVIAVVAGAATGGGVGLAAAADVVIASTRSTFAITELLFGLVPAVVTPTLLTRLSPARLTLWAMTGDLWDAEAAKVAGLVDVVVPVEALEDAASLWTRRVARADCDALRELKALLCDLTAGRAPDVAAITAARLNDPGVRGRLQAFAQDGVAPWRQQR